MDHMKKVYQFLGLRKYILKNMKNKISIRSKYMGGGWKYGIQSAYLLISTADTQSRRLLVNAIC